MAETSIDSLPQKVRDVFNRGFAALERGNHAYAINLFSECVELEPTFLQARRCLLAAEIRRQREAGDGQGARISRMLRSLPWLMLTRMHLRKGNGATALRLAERLLRVDILSGSNAVLFAEAADLAGLPDAGVLALEMARELSPRNGDILLRLGAIYTETGQTRKARECFERLSVLFPKDPDVIKQLKDAMARDSMIGDGWQQTVSGSGSFRDIVKDKDESIRLEQDSKAVKTDKDAETLIREVQAKIAAEPDDMNAYRSLARLYERRGMFSEAAEVLSRARERNPGDPEIDHALSTVRLQGMDAEIKALAEAGDTAAAAARRQERDAFELADLEDRVKRYPNDLRLRYDYGRVLADKGRLTEAIQQFQLAQRSPKTRAQSLFGLGMCFRRKGQNDLAVEQLEKAASEIVGMDDTKKAVLYELGDLHAAMGNAQKSLECFKRIYQADISFRDVAERVERGYSGG